jgi:hypothetical protein
MIAARGDVAYFPLSASLVSSLAPRGPAALDHDHGAAGRLHGHVITRA